MGINKVQYGNTVLIDLTDATATADKILQGYTAYGRDGSKLTGTATGGDAPTLQTKTYTVDSSGTETITADSGYDGLSSVSVSVPSAQQFADFIDEFTTQQNQRKWILKGRTIVDPEEGCRAGWLDEGVYDGMSNSYNAIPSNTSVTPSTTAQTIGGQRYMMEGAVTVNAMPTGTAGTPTATKGTVSNHSISVTPSVTNTTGYITGGTKTGTAVTVTASELASGNKAITSNGTNIDVVGYSTVSVDVQGGGGTPIHVGEADATSTTASISFTGLPSEPTSFFIGFVGGSAIQLPTGTPYKTIDVVYDGTNDFGNIATNINNAQASYSTNFSHSYSNGTLTVTGTESNFVGHYLMLYTYGGSTSDIYTKNVQVGSGVTSITFTGLEGEPTYWSCAFKSNFGTSSGYQRTIATAYGYNAFGSGLNGYNMSAAVGLSTTAWTASYNNGSLTITSQGTNAGGYFHQPGYYQLTYAYDDGSGGGGNYQAKTVTPTTSQQVVEADSGYDALSKVTVNAMPSMTLPTATSATSSGTSKATITPTSSTQYLNIPTGYNDTAQYYTISATSGGSVTVKTTTMSNTSATATQIQFTSLTGQPKAFFCRCTSNLSRNSSNRYYYIADIRWDGSSSGGVVGNKYYVYNGQYSNQTTGYSYTYSSGTLTLSTTGSQSASPGSFYNGTYELVYIY